MIKKCSKCGEEKPATLEYFHKFRNGLRADCKVCYAEQKKVYYKANKKAIAEQQKAYREANKKAIAERGKAYYEANKEAIAEKDKAYYEANKEAIAERKKAYYEANKEAFVERAKAYYEANKEAIAEQKKAYYKANKKAIVEREKAYYRTPKGKFRTIKKEAKLRNINFSLPFKLYESQLWGKPCHYCGCEIEITGLDRKDNDKGYEVGNVVPCCHNCNSKKKDRPYQVFIEEMRNE